MGAALKSDFSDQPLTVPPVEESSGIELSVVMPCLNEAETLESCIRKAQRAIEEANITAEVVIADNGSTDGSIEIAERLGARVVRVQAKGYGNALMAGIAAASGNYIIMGDADDSYDFAHLTRFVEQLRQGSDLVMGNRFHGGIQKGAMSPLHRYLGNPVLTGVGRVLFRSSVGDFHCGLRAFRKEAYQRMGLRTTGMEFASEMVVKATLFKMKISEVPTTLSPDGRSRRPHLRTWRDGWRHLRFLLLYSPRWLFLYPGIALFTVGVLLNAFLLPGPRRIGNVVFDIHTLLFGAMAILIGFQSAIFATFTKVFAISEGLLPEDSRLTRMFRYVTLEVGLILGILLVIAGAGAWVLGLEYWRVQQFGALDPERTLRIVIPGMVCFTLGFQVILCSFFLSVLGMSRR